MTCGAPSQLGRAGVELFPGLVSEGVAVGCPIPVLSAWLGPEFQLQPVTRPTPSLPLFPESWQGLKGVDCLHLI